jgi:proteasome lid subunit RPN8/RPN11
MIVRVKKHQLLYFKRKAIKSDVEVYAFLIGLKVAPNLVEVHKFKYPKLKYATVDAVEVDPDVYEYWDEKAKDDGLVVLGGIHSHVNWTQEMSHQDHTNHKANCEKISGIVGVIGGKAWINFWVVDSSLPCKVEYF